MLLKVFLSYHGIVEMNGSSDYLTATAYMAGSSGAGNIKEIEQFGGV